MDIRIVLERIEILDDRDHFGAGEIWFESRVQTSHGDGSEVSTRLPASGVFSVSDQPGENVIEVHTEIFKGTVSGELGILIRGGEKDWLSSDDPLGVYTRRFQGSPDDWIGVYRPDDESIESEDVGLWRLTYRIEPI